MGCTLPGLMESQRVERGTTYLFKGLFLQRFRVGYGDGAPGS